MELKILNEKHNALFGRKEIIAQINSEITPNRLQILDLISKKFTCPIDHIKIAGIRGGFGVKSFTVEASIYGSLGEKDAVELKKKKESLPVKAAEATAPQNA